MFALVDCNNFYASCERVFQPKLNNKPVVVLSNNDGCVIARSNEAKALDIPMGAPAFQYQELFDKHDVSVFSSNFELYGDMSSRVMGLLSKYTPDIEIYSIDEAFLKFKGFELFDLQEMGKQMKRRVQRCTGIPISIGFAETKALAKVANRIAKKFPEQTGGVYTIDSEEKRIKALRWLKIEDVWGIGRRHAKRLNLQGVKTALQFTQLPDDWVRSKMSVVGLRLKKELEGRSVLQLDEIQPKKNIATTRSFHKNYTNLEEVKERVSTFATICAEKLRKQKSCCNALMVFVHTNGHRKDLPQYSRNIFVRLPYPTNSSIDLSKYATLGLEKIYKKGFSYKKAGVIVMDIVPENTKQLCLYDNADTRHSVILDVIDKVNKSIGRQKIRLASQDLGRTWKMRQEKLSPRYSTRMEDILKIRCNVLPQ